MNLTELAHWRYRIPAIQAEIKHLNDNIHNIAMSTPMRSGRGEPTEEQVAKDEETRRKIKSIMRKEMDKRDFARWLLEEAKYKVQVGEVDLLQDALWKAAEDRVPFLIPSQHGSGGAIASES